MKIYAKLLVIALVFAMVFAVGSVSAVENGTADSSDLTLVPHEQVVSVPDSTVQEAGTSDLETSEDDTNVEKISSSSDEIINVTDSNVKESLKMTKKGGPVLGASNNVDVLGANPPIIPKGTTFHNISQAISSASTGDIIDLNGLTYTGKSPSNLPTTKAITIQNGTIDGRDIQSKEMVRYDNVILKNIQFINFNYNNPGYGRVFTFVNCTLENVKFLNSSNNVFKGIFSVLSSSKAINVEYDNIISGTCVADLKNSNLTNVNFTNSKVTDDTNETDTGQFTVMINSRMDNCNFINTSSNQHSGAICMAEGENTVINSNFINCSAWIGGAIYAHGDFNENKKYIIENCQFINCHAKAEGGALGLSHNNMDVKNCVFINNTATKGAGIMVGGINYPKAIHGNNTHGHNITIDNCTFRNNNATEEGGAVHISGDNNTFLNSKFYFNEAPEGGAVHITGDNAAAIGSIFDDNFAHGGKGAAIYVKGNNASVDHSKFTNHDSDTGTVYIEGDHFTCDYSEFYNNNATHGGAGIYVEGDYSHVNNSKFENNNASRHGGAIHSIGSNAKILNSEFRNNHAIPSSTDQNYGLGGAIFINGRDNEISYSKFKHNTARNGSAIYNNGDDLILNDDTFENNQAWSYFLFTEAKPPEAYWDEDLEVLVNVTLVAGDNLINAIYNNRTVDEVYFHNVTYTLNPNEHYPTGIRTTTDAEIHPVNGVENSHDGKYLYQDAREDDQVIKVNVTYNNGLVYEYQGKTNRFGNVLLSLKKENMTDRQFHPGVYNVTAEHPNDDIYTHIKNSTTFTINPHVDVSVTKTSDKDVYFVGENAIFTIRVYGVGTNATNVRVKDILPKSLKFVSASATRGSYDSVNNEWYIGFLQHEGSETLKLTVKTTELGTFDNVVNVTCYERDWNMSNNVDNKTIHVDLYYTKEANVTNTSAGEYLEYYIRIYNVGSTLYNETVRVYDVLPEGIRYVNSTVEGAVLTYHIGYPDQQVWEITNISAKTHAKITIKALALKDGIWNNTARVWDYPPVNATVNVTSSADLRIFKEASSEYVNKGDLVNWTIIVKNDGPSKAMDVYVRDVLPNGLDIYGTTIASKGNYNRLRGVWTIGNMDVGEIVTLTIPTRVTISAHNITNVAVVNSSTPDPNPTNNEDNDTVYFNPDVTIEKTVSTRKTYHGDTISWNITVTNKGPNDALNVYVIDHLPAGLIFVNSTRGNYNPVSGRWDIGTLKEGESITLIINTEVTIYAGSISNNATVYSSNDRDLGNNYADDFTQVITEADVGVVKRVSNSTSHYGDEITWYIVVTNYGPNVAENVVLIDYLPTDLVQTKRPYISKGHISHAGTNGRWDIGNMAVNESQYMEIYTKVNATDKNIINVVEVNSTTVDTNITNNRDEDGINVPPEADVAVVKKVNNFTPNKYDNVVWTITVVNNGPNVAGNVVVKDILPSGLKYVSHTEPDIGIFYHNTGVWSIGTLNVGVRHSFNITTQVVDTGKITNEVNITTSTYDTDLTNNYDNETIDVPAIADLKINKLVSNKTSKYGDLINWTVTVHNKGPNNARNVVVNDKLPAELVYISHKGPGLYDPTQGIWQIGDLGIDATVTLTITTRVNITNATITNVAVVTSTTPDNDTSNNEANNTTDVDPMADLAIYKVVSNTSPQKGDNVTWIIVVINHGPDTAINAVATDILPANLTYVSHKGNGTYDPNTGKWNIGDIEKGGIRALYINTTVNASKAFITNIVNVTSQTPDPDLTNNEDNASVDVGHQTDLEVIKTVSNATPKKGDKVVWNITVLNHGPDDAVNTRVYDILPSGLVWISDDSNGDYNPSNGVWTIGTLHANNNVTLLITTLVNVSGQNITNIAEVYTDTNDTNKSNNKDNDTVDVENIADLKVQKLVNPDVVVSGQTVYWTIYVENLGPDVAVDAYAIDKLPKELIFVKAYTYYGNINKGGGRSGTGKEYNATTGVWTIGNMSTGDYGRLTLETIANSTIETTIVNNVFTNSSTPDSDYTNNKAWNSVDVILVADLEIVKIVSDKNPKFGEEITWTITVTNNGPSDAKDVTVTDKLPAGLIFKDSNGTYDKTTGIWTVGDLANGKSVSLVITTTVNITNATITNVAVVNSTTPDNNTENNKANNTTDVDPEADLEIIKLVSNKNPKFGDEITWTIVVTNKGPDTALEVYVKDKLPAGLVLTGYSKTNGIFDENDMTWYIKSLAKGESQTLTLTTLVNVTNKTLVNIVNVTNDVYDPNKTNNEANNTTDVGPRADLVVVKEVSKQIVKTGEVITWTVTVTNKGPDTAVNTRVTDILPTGLIFKGSDGNYNSTTGIWTVGDLANGASASLVITTQVNITNATIRNVANATSDTPGKSTPGNNTTDVGPRADLVVVKLVSKQIVKTGETVTWTITVTNNGPDTAVNTRVTDELPAGLIYTGHKADVGNYDPDTGVWIVGDLAKGESKKLVISTIANIANKTIVNVANVTSDTPGNRTNGTNKTTTIGDIADLEVVKLVSNATPKKGDEITWTIIVTNHGPDKAIAVNVTDKLPAGLRYNGHSGPGLYDSSNGIWIIGDMEKGDSVSLSIRTIVEISNGTIENIAVGNSSTPDNNTDNNIGNNTTKVNDDADLEIVKIVSNKNPKFGETITWTVTVTNKGPSDAKNVRVTDKLPAGLIFNGANGNYNKDTGLWIVGDLANGKSASLVITTIVNITNTTILNVANVTSDTPDSNKTNNEANNTTDVGPKADLVIGKEVSKKSVKTGEVITWTITVTNNGPDTAVNTRVTDKLPAGLIYKEANGNYDPVTGLWIVGDLANGESKKLVISTQVNITNATIVNVANVTTDTPGNNPPPVNNTTKVGPKADLVIGKEVSKKSVKTGEVITWTITVTNNGPDVAVNTRVTDKLPAGLVYVTHSGEGNYDPVSGLWIVGDLANGESKKLVISTQVNITNATIVNVANVTTDTPGNNPPPVNNTTKVGPKADLVIGKEVSKKSVKTGEVITWTITVTNNGPDTAVNTRVTDKLPAGLIYKEANGNYDPVTGLWIVGDLANGETKKLVIYTQVNITNATIVNVANVTTDTPGNNPPPVNNTTKVGPKADLVIGKEVSKKSVKTGEVITWTITVTNNGPDTAVNTRVTDKLPAGLIYKEANGNYNPVTGLWIVGDLANGETKKLVIYTQVNITNATIVNVANVTTDTPGNNPPPVNNTTKVDPKADLVIGKVVSKKSVKTGEIITWTITVTNNGPDAAVNTRVTDKLPAGLIYKEANGNYDPVTGLWIVGDLANGESKKLVISTQVNITNATITNVANVTTDTPGNNPPPVNNTTKVGPKADLVIGKEVSKKSVKTGEIITWTITVTNNGPDAAVNTRVTDKLPAGLVYVTHSGEGNYDPVSGLWIVGDLANGETKKLVISTQVNITNATIVNVANVTTDTPGNNPPPVNNTTKVDPKADLVIGKEVSKKSVKTGEIITWTITVTNNGPDAAVNVRVTDKLPAGLIYKEANGNYDPVTGLWIVGDLANGQSKKLVISTQINITNATITNVANVTTDTPGNNPPPVNNTTKVDPKADLVVVKEVSKKSVKTGETVIWTITVTNNGPDAAVNTRVTDKLPAGLVYVTHSGEGNYDPVSGLWIVGDLTNGESKQLAISTIANISNKTIVNVANVTSDTPGDRKNDTNNTTVLEDIADLEVIKVVLEDNPHKGDVITWFITVINHGPSDAKNVIVTDRLPAGLIFNGTDGNYNPNTGVWTVGDLANGQIASLIITTIVDITNAEITNVAVVDSDTPDNNTDNNRDNDTTNVDPEADIKVIKTVSNPKPTVGDVITWTITVINLGPDAARDVVVEDNLPAGLKLVSAKGSTGMFEDGIWTVGTLNNKEAATLVLTTKVTSSDGIIRNVAIATTTTYDPNNSNNRDEDVTKPKAKPSADLEIIKEANVEKVKVGDKIIWTITVINHGPDVAKNVRVKEVMNGGAEYISSRATRGSFDSLNGVWTIGDMEVGDEVVLTIVCKALTAGTVINTAEVVSDTPDPDMENNKDKAIVTVKKNNPTPDNPPKTPKTPKTPATMHAAGNPIVMVLLALLAIAGVTLRRKY